MRWKGSWGGKLFCGAGERGSERVQTRGVYKQRVRGSEYKHKVRGSETERERIQTQSDTNINTNPLTVID